MQGVVIGFLRNRLVVRVKHFYIFYDNIQVLGSISSYVLL